MKLNLTRPLIVFDLETTGLDFIRDRIIQISYIKVSPDGTEERENIFVNPEKPIPREVVELTGITDDDVKDAPTFKTLAPQLSEKFKGCDFAGYNSNHFDIPMLAEEFLRAGIDFDFSKCRLIDAQTIFHKMEQRTLVAAYRFYCGKELEDAHSALADTRATYEVLQSQLDRYPQLENDVKKLADFSRSGRALDLASRIVLNDQNEPVFNFGKHKGRPVKEVFRLERSFYSWAMQADFPKNTKDVMTALYYEVYPPKSTH